MPWEGACRIKTSPVITHLQDDLPFLSCEPEDDGAGTCMLDDVVQSLLRDAVEGLFPLKREIRLISQVCLNGQLVACPQDDHLPGEGCHQPLAFQGLRTKLEDERVHLGESC